MAEVEENNNGVQRKTNKYNYFLIMFNKRGPKSGQPVYDFVPSSWVHVSKKTGKLVTKFMPPPYINETSALLHHLVETLSDPIADWPEYNIQLKGGAQSHEEAKMRLEELNAKEYAFTTDADEAPAEKASQIIRQLKQVKLKVSAATEAALQVSELNSDEDQDYLPKRPVNAAHRRVLKPKSSRSTLLGNKDILHDYHTGNPESKNFKKNQTDVTTFSSNTVDQNANLELQHSATKKDVSNERSKIINIDKQASISHSYVDSIDEGANLSAESFPERFHSPNRDHSRLFVDNVYTDSENEDHIEDNRPEYSVRDSSPKSSSRKSDFSETSHGTSSVFGQRKPLKPKSKKSGPKISTSCDDPSRLKSKRPESKSTSQHVVFKSKLKATDSKSRYTDLNRKGSKNKEIKSRDEFTSDSELLWQIYEDLQGMKVDIGEIRANQRKEEEVRHKSRVEHAIQEDFISKHNLELPYTEIDAFDEFNSNLSSNENFRQEFMKSLVKFFDRDIIASKTLNNILKKYLSRNLAMQHTALKKMPGKFLMKGTTFYDCLLGVLTETHRDKCGKFISESTFSSILGNALGNAKDWDGKKNRKKLQSSPDEVDSDD